MQHSFWTDNNEWWKRAAQRMVSGKATDQDWDEADRRLPTRSAAAFHVRRFSARSPGVLSCARIATRLSTMASGNGSEVQILSPRPEAPCPRSLPGGLRWQWEA